MAMAATREQAERIPCIPKIFTSSPPIRDALETESSMLQDETADECLPFLTGDGHDYHNAHGVPHLYRDRHVRFLQKQLGNLPSMFKSADPSRPWIFYWCLAGLSLLGHDVESYRSRLVETVRPMQNETGGFGGGFGQTSHLATTYATVLSLALVGGDEAYEVIDRRSMWRWLCSLKQPDGGFQMAIGGEEDVRYALVPTPGDKRPTLMNALPRGAYCAAVIISLLNIPLSLSPDSPACAAGHTGLFSGLGEWVRRCKSFAPEPPLSCPCLTAANVQARRTKEACRQSRASRPTGRMPFVPWAASRSWTPRIERSPGMSRNSCPSR